MQRRVWLVSLGLALILSACSQEAPQKEADNSEQEMVEQAPQDVMDFLRKMTFEVNKLYKEEQYVAFDDLQEQKEAQAGAEAQLPSSLSASTVKETMLGEEIYPYLKERAVYIGRAYYPQKSKMMQIVGASGTVIHEDGVILTNYHVLNTDKNADFKAMYVGDSEGGVYPVTAVLATSKDNDLAILQVDTQGAKLKYVPLANASLEGSDIYAMGHSYAHLFFMSKGIIGGKYISRRTKTPRINITAEYGRGASGGPIVNTKGELVGIISSTSAYYTGGRKKGDLQLIMKEGIPISTVRKFIKN